MVETQGEVLQHGQKTAKGWLSLEQCDLTLFNNASYLSQLVLNSKKLRGSVDWKSHSDSSLFIVHGLASMQ